ncbi:MAG: BlaI/MecI/CopY family transcriptional regulator [Capsulimonas sp.]|uniref:BlaI/MecI/CopY family transcriptional regulator n=1 Tax=Capsulimonas sp. TaxID=2494211 RepID=UPI00326334DE
MTKPNAGSLSRRERQIMDIVYERGEASAADVVEALPDAPSYSAVRALLRILEEKGHVSHVEQGKKYLFRPTQPRQAAATSALRQIVRTFFGGSAARAVTTLISDDECSLSDEDLDRLTKLIEDAKHGERIDGDHS